MALKTKTLRYFYWLVTEFVKKNVKLITISFIVSIIFFIGVVSLAPYIENIFTVQKQVVGYVGNYTFDTLPEEILSKISNGLLYINEKGEFVPTLSTSWEQIDSGRIYRFHLKKDLYWGDGSRFTSESINYKFKDVEIKTRGDYTVEFRLKNPLAIFPTYLTKPILKDRLVGISGLYNVDRIKQKYDNVTELSLSPNKKNLPILTYKFYNNETDLINAYKLGEITQMIITKKSVADTFSGWKNTEVVKTVDYSRLLTIFFNLKNSLLKEKEVRNAVNMLIDRNSLEDMGIEADSPIPSVSWAYNENLKKNTYDPELAKKILKKYIDASSSAKLNFSTNYDNYDIATLIGKKMADAGLDTNISLITFGQNTNFDILLAYWKVPSDPDQYYFWHSTQTQGNITGYKNLKIDKLLEDGRSNASILERKKIYADFQKILVDDDPAIFIYYPYTYTVKRK